MYSAKLIYAKTVTTFHTLKPKSIDAMHNEHADEIITAVQIEVAKEVINGIVEALNNIMKLKEENFTKKRQEDLEFHATERFARSMAKKSWLKKRVRVSSR